jgi:hypothetical protein
MLPGTSAAATSALAHVVHLPTVMRKIFAAADVRQVRGEKVRRA